MLTPSTITVKALMTSITYACPQLNQVRSGVVVDRSHVGTDVGNRPAGLHTKKSRYGGRANVTARTSSWRA